MKLTRRSTIAAIGGAITVLATRPLMAQATPVTHEVKMLNKATDGSKNIMVFEPNLVRAAPGDMIKLIPTDKSHSANSMKGLIPEGAEPIKTGMNEEVDVVLTVEGAYAIQCTPHLTMGMVLLVLVGDVSSNYAAVKEFKYRGKAKERLADIFTAADAILAAETAAG